MPKRKSYTIIAERVLAAVRELNAALVEAYEHPQVRVHMHYPNHETRPTQYGCEVTRITKHVITPEDDTIKTFQWRAKIIEAPAKKSKKSKRALKALARKAT